MNIFSIELTDKDETWTHILGIGKGIDDNLKRSNLVLTSFTQPNNVLYFATRQAAEDFAQEIKENNISIIGLPGKLFDAKLTVKEQTFYTNRDFLLIDKKTQRYWDISTDLPNKQSLTFKKTSSLPRMVITKRVQAKLLAHALGVSGHPTAILDSSRMNPNV